MYHYSAATKLGVVLVVVAFIGYLAPAFACDDCGPQGSKCCCSCSYSGPGDGGGTSVSSIQRNCENNQQASCSCGPGGATGSCTTFKNQGSQGLDPGDSIYTRQFISGNLLQFCRMVTHMDASWTCTFTASLEDPNPVVTNEITETATFENTVYAVASEHGYCVDFDGTNKTIHFFLPVDGCS